MKGNAGLAVLGLVLFALFGALVPISNGNTLFQTLGLGSAVTPPAADAGDCPETTPDWDPRAYDIENLGTMLTESNNIYRFSGDKSWSTFTQDTAVTGLPVGTTVEYVFGISTTDFTDNAYGPHGSFVVGCTENIQGWATDGSSMEGLYDDATEDTLTATFYNEDDNAAYQAWSAAGETHVVELKFIAPNEDYFGNPYIATGGVQGNDPDHRAAYPNMLCMDLNSTEMDEPVYVRIKGGASMNEVSTPSRHSGATGHSTYCYEAPVISDEEVRIEIALNADASVYPVADDEAYLYAGNFYIHTDTGDLRWGVEDNEGNAAGTDSYDTVTLDATS